MSGIESGRTIRSRHSQGKRSRVVKGSSAPLRPENDIIPKLGSTPRMTDKTLQKAQPAPIETPAIHHGGALDLAAQKYGIAAENWLDLSTGINPVGYPIPDIAPHHWQRLPLGSELASLKQAASRYYQLPSPDHLVCTAGTQSLIQTIPFWLRDHTRISSVHILGPTYAEHGRCWERAGHACTRHDSTARDRLDIARSLLEAGDTGNVVILVNPNNPDGGLIPATDIENLSKLAGHNNNWLIVDEAFIDCEPDQSICPLIDTMPNTLVLRSFGKFFGLAGIRIGCVALSPALARDLEERIGPWAIPGPSMHVATLAFGNRDWQRATRQRLNEDRQRLEAIVTDHSPLKCVGATSLFLLFEGQRAGIIADHLAHAGILVRLFDHDETKVRFGLPGSKDDWDRLETAFKTLRF